MIIVNMMKVILPFFVQPTPSFCAAAWTAGVFSHLNLRLLVIRRVGIGGYKNGLIGGRSFLDIFCSYFGHSSHF